jgi:DNA-binding NarL/FixJ family response regulator
MLDQDGITVVIAATDGTIARLTPAMAPAFEIVGVAGTLDEAAARAVDVVPDVLVVDDRLDRGALGDCCTRLRAALPATRILVLVSTDDACAYESLLHGAFCTIRQDAPTEVLLGAVRGAARGEAVIMPGCARRLLDDTAPADATTASWRLTRTETEVLHRIAAGEDPPAIAARHDVTTRLVNLHTGYAVAKVHLHTQRRLLVTQGAGPAPRSTGGGPDRP